MLIAKWQGTITLPALPIRKKRVGGNLIVQHLFMGATCKAQIFESDVKGHDLIRVDLTGPYRELFLRRKGARWRPNGSPAVTCLEDGDPSGWPKDISLAWDRLGELETYCDTPDKVLRSWANQFDFREEDEAAGHTGLRTPQIGGHCHVWTAPADQAQVS